MIVDVVTMRAKGVTLYVDYNFVEEGKPPFELREYESHKLMKASVGFAENGKFYMLKGIWCLPYPLFFTL